WPRSVRTTVSRRLPPCVVRWTLLEGGGHAFLVVVRRAEPRVRFALELQRRLERRLGTPGEYHFQGAERQRRALGELAGQSVDSLVEPLVRYRARDQPPGLGALGRDALAGHHEELPARHAHEPQRALGASAPGNHAQPHFRKRELG